MPGFDKELVNDVLKHVDITQVISAYLSVSKKGKNYVAVCPFHDDTNPSLVISPEKQIFKCFVCGTSGSAISFVQKYEHVPFVEALKKVAELANYHDTRLEQAVHAKPVDQTKEPLYKCLKDLTTYYQYALNTDEGEEGLQYFEDRHIDADLRRKFLLGYAFKDGKTTCKYLQEKGHSLKTIEDIGIASMSSGAPSDKNAGRVIFPICDMEGNVVGFSARRLKDGPEAKYINSSESPVFHKSNILYNFHNAKDQARISGYIYIVEGFMDVFALSKIGINAVVALMGTALTSEHIKMLRKLNVEIRLCLDGDLPGQTQTMKISKQLAEANLHFRIVDNQGSAKDPDEILRDEGSEKLNYYLNNLISRVDFSLNYFQRSNPLKTIEEKKKFIQSFIPILANVNSALELDSYIRRLSQITSFEADSIKSLVARYKDKANQQTPAQLIREFHPERKVLRRLQIAEREILYQMMNNPSAIDFYEANINGFYDEVYRSIANYIVDYCTQNNHSIDMIGVISIIEMSDAPNKNELISEITNLMMEKNHPDKCTDSLLKSLQISIQEEKENIFMQDTLEESLKGKSDIEKARILADYNRRKLKRDEMREQNHEKEASKE